MNEDIAGCSLEVQVQTFQGERVRHALSALCVEQIFTLYLNDQALVRLVASPCQLKELGAGFVVTEGLTRSVDEVRVADGEIRARSQTPAILSERAVMESSGAQALSRPVSRVASDLVITSKDVLHIITGIVSDLWQVTGGAHCSVLWSDGNILAKASDVGRHNTVDKVVGAAILGGMDLSRCVLGCTGRQPEGMVAKAARAGIPVVVSKAATTQKGVALAQGAGITLICRVRDDTFMVYSHAQRIAGFAKG
jgi:FdhD protein